MIPREILKKFRQIELRTKPPSQPLRMTNSLESSLKVCGIPRAMPDSNHFDLGPRLIDDEKMV